MSKYVLYDYLQVPGGAERLTLELMSELDSFQLVVARVFSAAQALNKVNETNIKSLDSTWTQWLGRVPEAFLLFKHATKFLGHAQVVLYSGIYAPLAVVHQKEGRRFYYCHTPPRFAYDWRDDYLQKVPRITRPIAALGIDYIRRHYESALAQMDVIMVNSESVQRRLYHYLGLPSEVVYPPINTEYFKWIEQGDYYLSLARLVPSKRVELIVRAFLAMPEHKLVIASGGALEMTLRALASDADNIFFTGWQSEEDLRQLIGRSRAVIYLPRDEDFGMSPVEAMSAGKPVIGVAEGGLLETILDQQTGLLLAPQPTNECIIDAVHSLDARRALDMRSACERRASLFSKKIFIENIWKICDF